jgi:hypothetical protein
MAIRKGTTEVCKINKGTTSICKAYRGNTPFFGCGAPIVVDPASANLSSKTYTFKLQDFTTNFSTEEGFTYNNVKLETLFEITKVEYLGNGISSGKEIKLSNVSGIKYTLPDEFAVYQGTLYEFPSSLDTIIADYNALGYKLSYNQAGVLRFTNESDETDIVEVVGESKDNSVLQLLFTVTDTQSPSKRTIQTLFSLIPTGDINVKPIYVNNPPIVGDNRLSTKYTESIVLHRNIFVDDTDPRFSDPEGDQPYELKVLTLPSNGTLYLRSAPVAQDQILNFISDIDTGDFVYTPDGTRTDIKNVNFEFAVSDTGSKTFAQ